MICNLSLLIMRKNKRVLGERVAYFYRKSQSFPKEINENRKCFPLDSFSILVCFERLCRKNSRCLRLFSYQESVAFGVTDELGCIQALNSADAAGI